MYELTGNIKKIFDTHTFDSGFTKRDFVVTTEEKYPQDIKVECIKEKTEILDGLQTGERVTVSFNLRGNEHRERYYVNLQAWKIDKLDAAPAGSGGGSTPSDTDDLQPLDDDVMPF